MDEVNIIIAGPTLRKVEHTILKTGGIIAGQGKDSIQTRKKIGSGALWVKKSCGQT